MTIKPSRLSRRDFLRLTAAGLGSLAAARLLTACNRNPAATTIVPATIPASPTATTRPTATLAGSRQEILEFFPKVPSRVIQTHHAGVWSEKKLVPNALRQMLDSSITNLTGLNDARQAWAALFKPGEKIVIKVNAFSNSIIWTHVPLVTAVTDSLQEAGIPPEQITIFDYRTTELSEAGFAVNADNPGVRCAGMDSNYSSEPSDVNNRKIQLANLLKDCDALINIPILKSHMMAGISFAMKNHYGSIWYPDALHGDKMRSVASLNALPEIKDRTRLIIGDALSANLKYANSWPYWQEDWIGDSIFMSYDPVAHDTLGLKLLTSELDKAGGNSASLIGMATPALELAAELGLGTNNPANMELIEQTLA